MRNELMVCPKMERCSYHDRNTYIRSHPHCHIHEKLSDCNAVSFCCPACEKFLGVVVENEKRIDDMSEGDWM